METKTIIYLVAFALILRIIVRLVVRHNQEQKKDKIKKDNDKAL